MFDDRCARSTFILSRILFIFVILFPLFLATQTNENVFAQSLDEGFNPGADNKVYTVLIQSDGKIVVGGQFNTLGGSTRYYLGRLNADGSLDGDFNAPANSLVFALAQQSDGKLLVGGNFTNLD